MDNKVHKTKTIQWTIKYTKQNNTMENKVHKTEQYNGNAFRNVYVPLVVSTSQSFPHS